MKKILLGGLLTLFLFSFRNAEVKYIYFTEYDAYIRTFNCSKAENKGIENDRKLIVIPKSNCKDIFVKCLSTKNNKVLEEGLYRCDSTTKDVQIESRNDNGSNYHTRKYYVPKRVGQWTFYKNGKKTYKTY